MQDRPTAVELLTAVRAFLERDLLPDLQGRKRFHALVAANVLAIVARELELGEPSLIEEWHRLHDLLGESDPAPPARLADLRDAVRSLNERLVERIRSGDADAEPFAAAVRRHVHETVMEKLRIASPPRERS